MDFPAYRMPPPPILHPFLPQMQGRSGASMGTTLDACTSIAWIGNNQAIFLPFTLTDWTVAYQLLFWVGATSNGNIDVGIYDSQKNRIVSAGSTAMSATVNTVQELNITDTTLPPGDYLLAGVCSTTTGTVFRRSPGLATDEGTLSALVIYEQATALPLPDPCAPTVTTNATPFVPVIGVQLRSVF